MQEEIWQQMEELAVEAGLDPHKFTAAHRAIVQSVVDFLERPSSSTSANGRGRP